MKNILVFLAVMLLFSCKPENNSDITQKESVNDNNVSLDTIEKFVINPNCALGVPIDNDSTDDYLIIRSQYIISYIKNTNDCNWVSWNLDEDWYGDAPKFSGNFKIDTSLPALFYHVRHADYTNSGYDRGHMVRSEERTKTDEDNISTFYLTNIQPQRPDLNRGVWLDLEYYCEDLCKKENKELYVIAGGIFHSDSTLKGEGKVKIPDSCFKIIVILNNGEGLTNISDTTEVIAVVMPNIDGIRSEKWETYKTTVDRIENSTGYDFMNVVPVNIQAIIEK